MPRQTPIEMVIATGNPGKVEEIREALSSVPVSFHSLKAFQQIVPVEEVGHTYEGNATLKALGYAKQTRLWALADDSGLEVDALGGKPGLHSARFGGAGLSDQERTRKLLEQLHNTSDREARFVCLMVLANWPDADRQPQVIHVSEGTCSGSLATETRGHHGFGFDPIFIPDGFDKTFAELPSEIKGQISHRGKALEDMRKFLIDYFSQT